MIELRPYEVKAAEALREACARHREVILVQPTGAGKSKQAVAMAAAAVAKGRRVIIGVPKIELVRQGVTALAEEGIAAGLIARSAPEMPELAAQIASIATLTRPRRLARWAAWRPDLLLIDECHHVLAPSWRRIIDTLPYARLIGFTATPLRLDGKGLGRIFSEMIAATMVKELIAGGWLSPIKTFAPPLLPDLSGVSMRRGDYVADELAQRMNQQTLVGDCVEHYRRHCNGGAALGYACTIAHSQALVEAFRVAGYQAQHVDADTKAAEREAAVAALGAGDINIIFNVGLFTEGRSAGAGRCVDGAADQEPWPLSADGRPGDAAGTR
jgi:DNA repair protein RadD